MPHVAPSQDQALCFYRAALTTARMLDHDSDARVLDADADAAWQAYGDDLPAVVRCDLVLRNFAMLYPAAFAPGPVFGLSGWYDDDPWGTGFERPPHKIVEGLFAGRNTPESPADALEQVLHSWGLAVDTRAAEEALRARISPSTHVLVSGGRAAAAVARVFLRGERLSMRSQGILVSADPAARQVLGVTCALGREAGVPLLADLRREPEETPSAWATREKRRLNVARADLLVLSPDASTSERASAQALAAVLGAADVIDIAAD
ncbi:hypothetical protein [Polyangium jinanense]|uniref:Uncharacterized protein n=1 Tax=Polyangium jinanense TaxID=2829994 RepID=A0A9X3XDU2_9BACT|nr:hypothetical protein [Polyangium jinanense]MDC3958997.1 hypothetical protein [Polyangium jinanense]MDC3988472.1 hypothetical protein [Polyangium jinanense]